MRNTWIFGAAALLAVGFAWTVEAKDEKPGADARLDAVEARLAAVEKRLAALEASSDGDEAKPQPPDLPKTPAAEGTGEGIEALRAARISVSFSNESAARVLKVVSTYVKVGITVSPGAQRRAAEATVTINLKNATVEEVLDAVTAQAGLAWTVHKYGVVTVTAADEK
jgi:hypothetical protein